MANSGNSLSLSPGSLSKRYPMRVSGRRPLTRREGLLTIPGHRPLRGPACMHGYRADGDPAAGDQEGAGAACQQRGDAAGMSPAPAPVTGRSQPRPSSPQFSDELIEIDLGGPPSICLLAVACTPSVPCATHPALGRRLRQDVNGHLVIAWSERIGLKMENVPNVDRLARLVGWTGQGLERVDWSDIEQTIGVILPSDFKEYVTRFPAGGFQTFLDIEQPRSADDVPGYIERVQEHLMVLREATGRSRGRRYEVFPSVPGLFPWGHVGMDYYLCWHIGRGHEDSPPVVMIDMAYG